MNDLDLSLLLAPFVAGLLVVATHVPLGRQVLARGIVFIDLAIAQVAGIGVIVAELCGFEAAGLGGQVGAVVAALAGALLLTWSERRWPEIQEALIGTLFVVAACAGILLLAHNPHGGEQLKDMLAGQILWVTPSQLLPTALLTALVLAVWFGSRGRLGRFGFYGVFAFAVTASVQLVGVYLVFATLIMPALATRRLGPRRLHAGYAVGAVGYALGLALSVLFDLPAGAVIVMAMAGVAILGAQFIKRVAGVGPTG
jgi:zinc/manganese transport system permease protein